ncbi:MAG TPA: SDR family oxidoreductase [Anaerolineales bacterium]|jgi:dTDP-4-dehydrorhamnose reductase
MTRILITGASGLLGLNLSLMEAGRHEIVGVDRSKLADTPFELIRADLLDPQARANLLDTVQPKAVIHTAANANVDACESDPQGAGRLNAELPGELAEDCAKREIRLVHISTDAVFDGTLAGNYSEDDLPNPLGVYAQTKLAGERNVLSADPRAIVARVNFFGWSLSGTRSLAEFFFNKLSAGEQCNGFTDVYFCPMFVGDLADTLMLMLDKELAGLYHVTGSEALSKHDFGQRIARQFGFDPRLVIPRSVEESGLKARRSHNLRLSNHKLSTGLGLEIPSVSTGIAWFYAQAVQGYPQKMRSYQQV